MPPIPIPIAIAFFLMAAFTLGGGVGVVTSRNLIHAALYLTLALFGIAGLFVVLEAPFLAAAQVLVYLGAIAVLITITIMVTRRIMGIRESVNRQWPVSAVVALLVFGVLTFVIITGFGDVTQPAAGVPVDDLTQLGLQLADWNAFFLPFEVTSVLLLAAMIGAIVVSRDAAD